MENYEVVQQRKLFDATNLKVDDFVVNELTGEKGVVYISGVGYACVRTGGWSAVIWTPEFVKDEKRHSTGDFTAPIK